MTICILILNLGGLKLEEKFSEAQRRTASKAILYALTAAEEALTQSELVEEGKDLIRNVDPERIGVAVGMGLLDLEDIQCTGSILCDKGYSRVSPYFIPRILPNLASGQISIRYGLRVSHPNYKLNFQSFGFTIVLKSRCTT